MLNISINTLSELCEKLNHMLQIIFREGAIGEAIEPMHELFDIAKQLVFGRYKLKGRLELITKSDAQNKGGEYEEVVGKIMELCPYISCRINQKIQGKQIDMVLEHKIKEPPFDEIRKYIYVECKNTKKKTDVEVIEKLGGRIAQRANRFCNTGLIVSARGFTSGAKEEAIKRFDNGILLILLNNRDLYEMIESDIQTYLSTKIELLFYGKIE